MKLRLKKKNAIIAASIMVVVLIEIINPFNLIASNKLQDLNYGKKSSKYIIKYGLKNDVLDNQYSEFIDKNISDKNFKVDYYDYYKELGYYKKSNDVNLVNSLIEKGYSALEIDCILKTGTIDSIKEFLLRDKLEGDAITKFLVFEFADLRNLDKYIEYKELNVCTYEDAVLYINLGLDREFYTDYNDVKNFSYTMLVNKYNKLSSDFVPNDLISFPSEYCSGECEQGNKTMVEAFSLMANDLYNEKGLKIYANSAYRSYSEQEETYDRYLKLYGEKYVYNNVSLPGFSEHQTGLCVDVKAGSNKIFKGTEESKWLKSNAHKYGFILRFEASKQEITGYKSEEWHYRYVGTKVASYIKENKITFEEYYVRFLYNEE